MSHKHEKMLAAIFHDPVSGNLHWREIESLLKSLGAEFHELPGARIRLVLNGVEGMLHRPHHSSVLPKHDVRHLRQYLSSAGYGSGKK
ncbi:MAG: type II toxin-antitoxin system HicA family toxin [Sedimenticola sp.]